MGPMGKPHYRGRLLGAHVLKGDGTATSALSLSLGSGLAPKRRTRSTLQGSRCLNV